LKENSKNNIEEFNIENYTDIKARNKELPNRIRNDKIFDEDFTLITLPEVSNESSSIEHHSKVLKRRPANRKCK
jgi:hypothetical protein